MERSRQYISPVTPMYYCISLLKSLGNVSISEGEARIFAFFEQVLSQSEYNLASLKKLLIGGLYMLDSESQSRDGDLLSAIVRQIGQSSSFQDLSRALLALCDASEQRQIDIDGGAYALRAYQYIRLNYASSIQLKTIACEMFISPSYLSRIIKEYFGRNFVDILIEVRLSHAKDMLVFTRKSIKNIAEDCGFSDYIYFYKTFYRVVGMSPSQFRTCHAYLVPVQQGDAYSCSV